MKGSYIIKIHNHRVSFTLEIERNITVICGNSATGKTTLFDSVANYEELGDKSGVTIDSLKECRTLRGRNWYDDLRKIRDSFVFIDEGNDFISSKEFASAIKNTDNYYILITRENLYQLPYSVDAVLELHKTTSRFKHTYNRTFPKYDHIDRLDEVRHNVDAYVTEDSDSGHELFAHIAHEDGIECIAAGGKSRILSAVQERKGQRLVVIADGAAFGANMMSLYKYMCMHQTEIILYLPESFEWLILASGIINDPEIDDILKSPADHIDSKVYFSWEQFFTFLLESKTKNTPARYSKKKLSAYYLQKKNLDKIIMRIRIGS